MKTLLVILSLLVVGLALPPSAFAKKKGGGPPADTGEQRIVEISPVSITVTLGKTGDEHVTYKITDSTKVTLNGAPIFARDLKAGQMAKFTLSEDHSTALTIEAKDPPAHPDRHHVG
jgi:hypothetical protein